MQRVGLDLDRLGKLERQRGRGTWISDHRLERLAEVRQQLCNARAFARVNPLNPGTAREVEAALAFGAQVLMLPMWESAADVERFLDMVGGRAFVVPLLETRGAGNAIEDVVELEGIEEVHVGINDLALSTGARQRFEVLDLPLVSRVARTVCSAGLRLGIGAVGDVADGGLPVAPDLLYARYVQLGANASLLARSFLRHAASSAQFVSAVRRTRERIGWWRAADDATREAAREQLCLAVAASPGW